MESRYGYGRGSSYRRSLCGRTHGGHRRRQRDGGLHDRPRGVGARSSQSASNAQRNDHVRRQRRRRQFRGPHAHAFAKRVRRPARNGRRDFTARRLRSLPAGRQERFVPHPGQYVLSVANGRERGGRDCRRHSGTGHSGKHRPPLQRQDQRQEYRLHAL